MSNEDKSGEEWSPCTAPARTAPSVIAAVTSTGTLTGELDDSGLDLSKYWNLAYKSEGVVLEYNAPGLMLYVR